MEEVSYRNPYLNNLVIRDAKMIFGRSELYQRTYAVVAVDGSLSLVGPPRIGKGSFLYCLRSPQLQQRYGKGYIDKLSHCIFVFVDIRTYAHRNRDSFFKALNKEIVMQCRGMIDLDTAPREGSEGFTSIIDEITEQGYRLVLAFDSFEKLKENERLSGPLPMFLRSEAERVSYVIASTIPLREVFPNEPLVSPFYNIFLYQDEKIGPLAPFDAREFVTIPAEDAGLPFSAQETDWILEQGGMQPFFLQVICRIMFDMKAVAPGTQLDLLQMESQAYEELFPHFESLWMNMGEQEREQMRYQLKKAEMADFYASTLFRRFVKARWEEGIAIEMNDIKDALKKIGDLPLLGTNRLRYLEVVKTELKDHLRPSPSEIGFSIRLVLHKAHDQLKGQGFRTDTAPDWEAFNILFYCYFKHHMPHKTLSRRLGMSPRTLYRKKDEALKKLLIALQEMEAASHSV